MRKLAVIAGVLCYASVASASTVTEMSLEDLARGSDVAVIGKIIGCESFDNGEGRYFTRCEMSVSESLKNGKVGERLVFETMGGAVGEFAQVVVGEATFVPGENVAVFFMKSEHTLHVTSLSQGKFIVVDTDRGRYLVSSVHNLNYVKNRSAGQRGVESRKIYTYEEFKARVSAAKGE